MRKLKQVWQALERIHGLIHVPAYWREFCGPEFPLIETHLRPTDCVGAIYPCPHPTGAGCPRKIVDYGDGEFVAICRDPHIECGEVPLTQKEALSHRLDIAGFSKMIAAPLGIRWEPPVECDDHTWSIGVSERRSTRGFPVYFIALPESRRFSRAVTNLILDAPGTFLLVAPTNRHRTAEVQRRLQSRGIPFVSLEEQLLMDEKGKLVFADPTNPGDVRAPTPVKDRPRVVQGFCLKHRCRVRDLQEAAGVDDSDFYKWRSGSMPDHYAAAVRIETVLHNGLPVATQQK